MAVVTFTSLSGAMVIISTRDIFLVTIKTEHQICNIHDGLMYIVDRVTWDNIVDAKLRSEEA